MNSTDRIEKDLKKTSYKNAKEKSGLKERDLRKLGYTRDDGFLRKQFSLDKEVFKNVKPKEYNRNLLFKFFSLFFY